MIEGSRQFTLNGVVPILAVISLVYGIQLIVHSAQRRRRERAEAERLQSEQEAAQAQQEADAAALYPVAGSTYPAEGGGYGGSYAEQQPVRGPVRRGPGAGQAAESGGRADLTVPRLGAGSDLAVPGS